MRPMVSDMGIGDYATSTSSICGTSVRCMPVVCDQFPRKTTVCPALRRGARRVVRAFGWVIEQEGHSAALLGVPKRLERDHQRGGQPFRELERFPRGLRELGTLRGAIVILRLELQVFARFRKRRAQRVWHHAVGHGVVNVSGH